MSNPASTRIEVRDDDLGILIAAEDSGEVGISVEDASGRANEVRFELRGNCQELAVQFDYILRESNQALLRVKRAVASPDSWMGKINDRLSGPAMLEQLQRDHNQRCAQWARLRNDLLSLRPFKERLATWRLLERTSELANRLLERSRAVKKQVEEATERISTIVASSSSDLDTGRLQVPRKWAKEYAEQVEKRDGAMAEMEGISRRLEEAAAQVKRRVNNPELLGLGDLPYLKLIGNIPKEWQGMVEELSDGAIGKRLVELEGRLGVPLGGGSMGQSPRA